MTRVGFGACVFMGAHAFAGEATQGGGLMIGGVRVPLERRVGARSGRRLNARLSTSGMRRFKPRVVVRSGYGVAAVKPAGPHELPMIEAWPGANALVNASAGAARR